MNSNKLFKKYFGLCDIILANPLTIKFRGNLKKLKLINGKLEDKINFSIINKTFSYKIFIDKINLSQNDIKSKKRILPLFSFNKSKISLNKI